MKETLGPRNTKRKIAKARTGKATFSSEESITLGQHVCFVRIKQLVPEVIHTFPNSTPHWSKELMPHMKPCTATLCS